MILPYSHQAAMAQAPVPFFFNDQTLVLYPIRQGDAIAFGHWLKYHYAKSFDSHVKLLPQQERAAFIDAIFSELDQFDYQYGKGREFLHSSVDALVEFISVLTRHKYPNIRSIFFFDNVITDDVLDIIDEMRIAVLRQIPPPPPRPNIGVQKEYVYNEEEAVIRVYRSLGEKYHWTYQQCLALTSYQIYWYLYLLPEEREQIEELHRISEQNHTKFSTPNALPGTMHFNSPEEYDAWLASQKTA